jgi:hypothetical protein
MTTPQETLHPRSTVNEPTYQYPHASKVARLASLEKRKFWRPNKYKSATHKGFLFEEELQQRRGPFLELGGPTDEGYFHLDQVQLPKRVLLSNVEMPDFVPQEYRDDVANSTDFVIDGSDIDLPDDSLGMVMASHIPYISFDKFDSDGALARAKDAPLRALEQGAITPDILEASLRLKMASEVYRTLEPGGLFLTDGHFKDVSACELLGFQLMTSVVDARDCYRQDDNRYYRVVLQKPKTPTSLDA